MSPAETESAPPPGSRVVTDPQWDAWTPAQAAQRLAAVTVPWYVAGGWALDLFRGQPTRAHEDLEIAVPAAGFPQIRGALDDLEFDAPTPDLMWSEDSPAFAENFQSWGRDRGTDVYRIDVFREPHDGDTWVCRRDESIRWSYDALIERSADGIPYLVPEVVLLFKAKDTRPKDQADFRSTLPLLSAGRRAWLAWALERVHPGHRWLGEL